MEIPNCSKVRRRIEAEKVVAPHIEEFWNAVTLDVEWLGLGENTGDQPEETVAGLSEKALWLGGTPVWASRRWADFKDKLLDAEGWQVWIGWYEARLAGQNWMRRWKAIC